MAPDRAVVSLRIAVFHWQQPERVEEILGWLRQYPGVIEEVALFTGEIHPPLPLAVLRERAATMAGLLPRFRAAGVRAGINHLSTIGHLDEYLDHALAEPWQRLVDANGTAARGCYCPRDPRMREYIRDCYAALAAAGPDFIWVDDDVRIGHHPPAAHPCFCPLCLAAFAQRTGREWTREALVAALGAPDPDARFAWRRRWLAHNRDTMDGIFADARAGADTVNPELVLGWMSCEAWYEGWDQGRWFATLAGPRDLEVKARPGGGFYTDRVPADLLAKAHSIGRQIGALPDRVRDIQSEHENFPYQRLGKSAHLFATEVGAYIAAGCTGSALNLMGTSSDSIAEFSPCIEAVERWRAFFDAEVAAFGRSPCEGLWAATCPDLGIASAAGGNWFAAPTAPGTRDAGRELAELGLPLAYTRAGAAATILGGDAPLAFSRDELLALLADGVWLDGAALAHLHALGLGEHTGTSAPVRAPRDCVEILTADPCNGPYAGRRRDTRPSFWHSDTWTFTPAPGARALAHAADIAGKPCGVTASLCENALGGRVAVAGYTPWTMLGTLAKTAQVKAVARWLAGDRLPAWLASYHRVSLWCRRDPAGRPALLVVNASLDPVSDAIVAVADPGPYLARRVTGAREPLAIVAREGGCTHLRLPPMGPWEMLLLRGA